MHACILHVFSVRLTRELTCGHLHAVFYLSQFYSAYDIFYAIQIVCYNTKHDIVMVAVLVTDLRKFLNIFNVTCTSPKILELEYKFSHALQHDCSMEVPGTLLMHFAKMCAFSCSIHYEGLSSLFFPNHQMIIYFGWFIRFTNFSCSSETFPCNMEVNSSTQRERNFYAYLPIDNDRCENVRCSTVLSSKIFDRQFFGNLPQNETKIVKFLQYEQKMIFIFKKWVGFLDKKLEFFKVIKSGNFAVESVSNPIISKKSSFFIWIEGFL